MSHVTELARAEADAVEAADPDEATEPAPDDGTDTEPDTEPEPEPAKAAPALDPEKALAALAKEDDKHAKAVARIMGDDFALVHRCQHCTDLAAGFTFEAPTEAPEMKHPDDYKRCEYCNGWGLVLTGAVSEIGATQTCPQCAGQGFLYNPVAAPQPTPQAPPQVTNGNQTLADQLRAQGFMVIDPPASPVAP